MQAPSTVSNRNATPAQPAVLGLRRTSPLSPLASSVLEVQVPPWTPHDRPSSDKRESDSAGNGTRRTQSMDWLSAATWTNRSAGTCRSTPPGTIARDRLLELLAAGDRWIKLPAPADCSGGPSFRACRFVTRVHPGADAGPPRVFPGKFSFGIDDEAGQGLPNPYGGGYREGTLNRAAVRPVSSVCSSQDTDTEGDTSCARPG